MRRWRLVDSVPSGISSQMELDRQLFEAFIQNPETHPALRIFQVSEPGISLGRLSRARTGEGSRHDLSTCVRPTGGGRVEHGNDLIYSVMARRDSYSTFHQVRTSYLSFHEALQTAFRALGVETELFRCDDSNARRNSKLPPGLEDCFKKPVPTDLQWKRRKIAGGAQWRRREGFLHQGSVQLVDGINYDRLKNALIRAFEEKFGIEFEKIPAVR